MKRIPQSEPALSRPGVHEPGTPGVGGRQTGTSAERYRRVALIGEGGMGEVWLGWDCVLERNVAIKVPRGGPDSTAATLLAREATINARLEHPALIVVHDILEIDGEPSVVSAWVPGRTLAEAAREPDAEPRELLRHIVRAAEGLAHAHRAEIVHSDVSPANVLVGEDGAARLIDWGLAAPVGETRRQAGTPGFAAPELSETAPTKRSDVWSLAATVAWAVRASRPASSAARAATPLDDELRAIIDRGTAADPARRYPDAGAFADDLQRWLDGRPVEAQTASLWRLLRYFVARARVPLAVAAVGLLLTAAALIWGWQARGDQMRRAEAATRDARQHLARSIAVNAREAWRRGDAPGASQLATEALAVGPSPLAAGILALARAESTAVEQERIPVERCDEHILHPTRPDVRACIDGRTSTLIRAGETIAELDYFGARPLFLGDRAVRIVSGGLEQTWLRDGTVEHWPGQWTALDEVRAFFSGPDGRAYGLPEPLPCGQASLASVAGRSAWVACHDGNLYADNGHGWTLTRSDVNLSALAATPDGGALLGARSGRVTRVGAMSGVELDGAVARIEPVGLSRAWVLTSSGTLSLIDTQGWTRLYSRLLESGTFSVGADGSLWIVEDDALVSIGIAQMGRSHFATRSGATWVGWDDETLLATDGSASLLRLDRSTGSLDIVTGRSRGVGRSVLALGGEEYAVADQLGVWLASEGSGSLLWDGGLRDAAVTESGEVILGMYNGVRRLRRRGDHWVAGAHVHTPGAEPLRDIALAGSTLWVASETHLTRIGAEGETTVTAANGVRSLAGLSDGTWAALQDGAVRIDAPGRTGRTFATGCSGVSIALSPVRDHAAVGCLDGSVRFVDFSGRLLAEIPAHTQRVASVAFDETGDWLASAGWDGRVVLAHAGGVPTLPRAEGGSR